MKKLIGLFVAVSISMSGCVSETSTVDSNEPTSSPTPVGFEFPEVTPPSKITLDNLDPEYVRKVAGRKLWEHYKQAKPTEVKLNHILSESYPREIYESSLSTYQAASDFFGEVGDVSSSYIFWITEKDADWINKKMCDVAGYCPGTGQYYHDIGASMKQGGDCGNNGGELRMGNSNFLADCWYEGQDKNKQNPAAHAFTHFVEMSTFKDRRYSSWWVEGTANHFEWFIKAVVVENYDEYKFGLAGSKDIWNAQDIFTVPETPSAKDYKRMFDLLREGRQSGNWMFGYYLGSMCVEALIAVYDVQTVLNNFELVGELGFEKAFKKSFGLSSKEFESKVLPYVIERQKLDTRLIGSGN